MSTQSLIPREAAQLALSLELLRASKTGGLDHAALARVRKQTREISGCAPAFAAKLVEELTHGIPIKPGTGDSPRAKKRAKKRAQR